MKWHLAFPQAMDREAESYGMWVRYGKLRICQLCICKNVSFLMPLKRLMFCCTVMDKHFCTLISTSLKTKKLISCMITQESNSEAILHNCLHTRKHKETWKKNANCANFVFWLPACFYAAHLEICNHYLLYTWQMALYQKQNTWLLYIVKKYIYFTKKALQTW